MARRTLFFISPYGVNPGNLILGDSGKPLVIFPRAGGFGIKGLALERPFQSYDDLAGRRLLGAWLFELPMTAPNQSRRKERSMMSALQVVRDALRGCRQDARTLRPFVAAALAPGDVSQRIVIMAGWWMAE